MAVSKNIHNKIVAFENSVTVKNEQQTDEEKQAHEVARNAMMIGYLSSLKDFGYINADEFIAYFTHNYDEIKLF